MLILKKKTTCSFLRSVLDDPVPNTGMELQLALRKGDESFCTFTHKKYPKNIAEGWFLTTPGCAALQKKLFAESFVRTCHCCLIVSKTFHIPQHHIAGLSLVKPNLNVLIFMANSIATQKVYSFNSK